MRGTDSPIRPTPYFYIIDIHNAFYCSNYSRAPGNQLLNIHINVESWENESLLVSDIFVSK